MRILVLGGCGFIGSHVVDALIARGHSVVVLDRGAERFRPPLVRVDYHFGDFAERPVLLEVMSGVDAVIHLVSTTFPGTANHDPRGDVTGNLVGTLGVLDAMVSLGVPRIIYLSSGGTVYGNPQVEPIPEDHPLRPINSYGIVKVAIEHYLEFYHRTHGLSTVAIRAANPFGPRQGHAGVQGAISTFMRCVRDDRPIEIWGDGSVVRDYLYVADLADLCVLSAEGAFVGPLNAGSGIGRSLNEVVAALAKTVGAPLVPLYKPGRALDVPRSVLDVSRAKMLTGWSAVTDFESALERSWAWLREGAD